MAGEWLAYAGAAVTTGLAQLGRHDWDDKADSGAAGVTGATRPAPLGWHKWARSGWDRHTWLAGLGGHDWAGTIGLAWLD